MTDNELVAELRAKGCCPNCSTVIRDKGAFPTLTSAVQAHEALVCTALDLERKGTADGRVLRDVG